LEDRQKDAPKFFIKAYLNKLSILDLSAQSHSINAGIYHTNLLLHLDSYITGMFHLRIDQKDIFGIIHTIAVPESLPSNTDSCEALRIYPMQFQSIRA